jgi:hypothetical protein
VYLVGPIILMYITMHGQKTLRMKNLPRASRTRHDIHIKASKLHTLPIDITSLVLIDSLHSLFWLKAVDLNTCTHTTQCVLLN